MTREADIHRPDPQLERLLAEEELIEAQAALNAAQARLDTTQRRLHLLLAAQQEFPEWFYDPSGQKAGS